MNPIERKITVTSPVVVRPQGEILVSHRSQRICQVTGCAVQEGTGFRVVRVAGRRIDPKIFPWPSVEPGDLVSFVLINTTDAPQRLGVQIRVREVR